ncbi:MAG: hypothetical protein GEU79_04350 [Acidimicrobiia bacterium]|nr:hypothetical protein [Acidimicrobiia bacterium]
MADATKDQSRATTPTPGPLRPVEFHLALSAVKRGVVIVPLLVAAFWIFRGTSGAIGSVIGGLVVVGNFLLAGWIMSVSARMSLAVYHAAALLGFVLRVGLIMLTVIVMTRMFELDRTALGVSAVVAYLVLLALEARSVVQGKERKMV